jgi:hypothetical protein
MEGKAAKNGKRRLFESHGLGDFEKIARRPSRWPEQKSEAAPGAGILDAGLGA